MPEISEQTLAYIAAGMALLGLMAYVCLAGADFGGGVWDLFASGPRKQQQRDVIAHAIGPVWEANHVWLIFVLVVLFTCFPRGYSALMEALFIPLHLVLAGIMLRGAAFVFRNYGPGGDSANTSVHGIYAGAGTHYSAWGVVFGASSVISPLLMGLSFGVVTSGQVHLSAAGAAVAPVAWLGVYPMGCAILNVLTCAYIAAVYLMAETHDALREDFRRRAIIVGTATAGLALAVLYAARREHYWLYLQLFSPRALPVLLAGGCAFALSALAVFGRRVRAARALAVAQTSLMLLGWGLAYRDFLIYPDVPLATVMAPAATVRFMLVACVMGMAILVPSLVFMLRIFKAGSAKVV